MMKWFNILLILACMQLHAATLPQNTPYQLCFSPQDNCIKMLTDTIKNTHHSIYVQAYSFTSYTIARALVHAAERGVKVAVILDKSNFKPGQKSVVRYLMRHHIAIWEDDKPNIAHNKVMIFDDSTIETGSFNYTYSAQHFNAENMLILSSHLLANRYLQNWQYRKQLSHFKST